MYLTRITRTDGQVRTYVYEDIEDAVKQVSQYSHNAAGIYKNVAVLHVETTTVLAMQSFRDEKPGDIIAVGSIVQLKDEYCKPEELRYVYEVVNLNEATEHVEIKCLNSLMTLQPIETVSVEMIRLIK